VPRQEWAARVAALRKQLGLLQADFGQLFGVRQSSVSRWENGGKEPSVENYIRMANLADEASYLWFLERAGVDTDRLERRMTLRKTLKGLKKA
jgi:transcriptional regulator with XRE-family HTH domain